MSHMMKRLIGTSGGAHFGESDKYSILKGGGNEFHPKRGVFKKA